MQAPARVNCDSLRSSNKYSFRAPNGQSFTTSNQFYEIYTEGDVSISVGVTASNNQNFVSLEESRQYQTATLRKYNMNFICFQVKFHTRFFQIQHYKNQANNVFQIYEYDTWHHVLMQQNKSTVKLYIIDTLLNVESGHN